ncbi:MAG: excinuclease ABC subunit UvrA [Bacilli bacterium]
MKINEIVVKGARENNLKNVDISIPKDKFIVMTGVSGSGKSSLAFDTIYAEGQRRYVESLSAYARQFLGNSEKPDVDSIDGLSPAISIDQKSTNKNPRSTVGTITEIYDYLRLLYARIGTAYCPVHKEPIIPQTIEEIVDKILSFPEKSKIQVISPIISRQKGTHSKLFEDLKKDGFRRVIVNGEQRDLDEEIVLEKNKKHTIELIVDRLVIKPEIVSRLTDSVEIALKKGDGNVIIDIVDETRHIFSENYACKHCDFVIPELEPRLFSFNAPLGACEECKGLGVKLEMDIDLVIPDRSKSIMDGAIATFKMNESGIYIQMLQAVADYYDIDLTKSVEDLSKKELDYLMYGTPDEIEFSFTSKSGTRSSKEKFEGIIKGLERRYLETSSSYMRDYYEGFMKNHKCNKCNGSRLKSEVLSVLVGGKNIYEFTTLSISNGLEFMKDLELTPKQESIARLILKEIVSRLEFLVNVGLTYLTLEREAGTLSGGESQRIRLATQVGSQLTGVLYVLDEPSIGLHQRDNDRLIASLRAMTELGNTLVVVEHDEDTMKSCDYIVDIGPGAGRSGGEIVFAGTYDEILNAEDSITGRYLSGREKIDVPESRRSGNSKKLAIKGASENNLKNINVTFPLGMFNCVTGVSGSGKSTLVNEILYKVVANEVNRAKHDVGAHKSVSGVENLDKVINISQSPIGKTPRSNPATYVGVFDKIRDLFAALPESKVRGYKKGRFSFNVKGGRCEACNGDGVKKIEMHFLPDVYIECEVCKGKRYNRETLDVKFKGHSISDVLDLTVEDACDFFANQPSIINGLNTLSDVGLSYIKLGQAAPTLSGGEAQRVKLAKELQKRSTSKTLYILDEPTTGLHTDDVKKLIGVLNRIADNGDTLVVIEHNLDVIKMADNIIDLGPEGGDGGGVIIATGTPEEIVKYSNSYTGQYLKNYL